MAGSGSLGSATGVEVVGEEALQRWLTQARLHSGEPVRPAVTWSFAATLDGRSAAADQTSRWISNPAALLDVHRLRSESDAVLVATQTVVIDNPALTARDAEGNLLDRQPRRVVMGMRDLRADLKVFDARVPTMWLQTRDPHLALGALALRGCRQVMLEGGPTLAAAFLRAGLIDQVVAYIAPMLLGAGRTAVADFGVRTISEALGGEVAEMRVIEGDASHQPNLRITLKPRYQKLVESGGPAGED